MMKLHEKVRKYRLYQGIKQNWLADRIGISEKTLNGIELGRQRLSADMFELICKKGFQVDPGIFFDDQFLKTKNCDHVEPTGTDS